MILAIYGSWQFNNADMFDECINNMISKYGFPVSIYAGDAYQTTELVEKWIKQHNVPSINFQLATHFLAFPAIGGSHTQETIEMAKKAGKIVHTYWVHHWPARVAIKCLHMLHNRKELPLHKNVLLNIICPMIWASRNDEIWSQKEIEYKRMKKNE